jgi:predicted metal-dependent peptidase
MGSNMKYASEYTFYMFSISGCNIVFNENFPARAGVTFNIDRYILIINPIEFNKLSLLKRMATLKHEMLHIYNNHIVRLVELKDAEIANIAADCAINQLITRSHFEDDVEYVSLPDTVSKWFNITCPPNLNAEQYYDLIIDSKVYKESQKGNKSDSNKGTKSGESGESGTGVPDNENPLDSHELWEASTGDPVIAKAIAKEIMEKSITKSRGNIPNEVGSLLALLSMEVQIDWKDATINIVGNRKANKKKSYKKPNRRMPTRIDVKGTIKDITFDLVCILDVSGSMSNKEIMYGLNELREICDMTSTAITIIQVDTEVHEVSEFDVNTTKINRSASGGTHIYPAIQYLYDNDIEFDGIVVITDGGIENVNRWANPPMVPVIFVTTDANVDVSAYNNYMCLPLNCKG